MGAPKGTPNSNVKIKSGTVNGCKLDNLQNPKIQCDEIWTNLQNANRNGTDDQLLGVTVETATSINGQEVTFLFLFYKLCKGVRINLSLSTRRKSGCPFFDEIKLTHD